MPTVDLGLVKGPKGDPGDRGEQGIQGVPGPQGNPGYTPVRGTDYFTEADKQDLADAAAEKVINESVVGQILGIDTTPTSGSGNLVTSGGVYTSLQNNDPRQWGLGTSGVSAPNNDFNQAISAGFYAGAPSDSNGPGWWCSILDIPRSQSESAQVAFRVNACEVAVRQCNNGTFGNWVKFAFQTPLAKYTLPGSDGFNSNSAYAYYTKDQFGLVTVIIYGTAAQKISAGVDTQISLLPEGFRPAMELSSCGWSQSGSVANAPGAIWMKPTGVINYRASVDISSGTYIFGQISFIAG